jgi:hypothetical protein
VQSFFALAVLACCASTNVTQLARPNQIWVYDFIADPARISADTSCELLPGWREQSHDGAKADVVTELFDFSDVHGFEFGLVILWQSNGKLQMLLEFTILISGRSVWWCFNAPTGTTPRT